MALEPLQIESELLDDHVILRLQGDLDMASSTDIDLRLSDLANQRIYRVIVDLTSVTFIDSMGLGSLINGRKALEAVGGTLTLVADDGPARRLLTLTKLDEAFPTFDTVEAARRER